MEQDNSSKSDSVREQSSIVLETFGRSNNFSDAQLQILEVHKINEQNLLKQLNKQVDFQNKKINELKVNYCYKVISFKNIDTKFGKRCIVTLLDTFENVKFDMFLPEKYNDIPTNSNVNNIQLICEGMNLATNGNRYHKIICQ